MRSRSSTRKITACGRCSTYTALTSARSSCYGSCTSRAKRRCPAGDIEQGHSRVGAAWSAACPSDLAPRRPRGTDPHAAGRHRRAAAVPQYQQGHHRRVQAAVAAHEPLLEQLAEASWTCTTPEGAPPFMLLATKARRSCWSGNASTSAILASGSNHVPGAARAQGQEYRRRQPTSPARINDVISNISTKPASTCSAWRASTWRSADVGQLSSHQVYAFVKQAFLKHRKADAISSPRLWMACARRHRRAGAGPRRAGAACTRSRRAAGKYNCGCRPPAGEGIRAVIAEMVPGRDAAPLLSAFGSEQPPRQRRRFGEIVLDEDRRLGGRHPFELEA